VEEVTVVADRFRAGDPASPSRQTLTSAELRDLGSVLTDDPYRAIQALPGVAAGDDFRSEFSVRGSDFRHIGQSVDGVPIGWLVHATRGTEDTNGSVSILNGDVIDQAGAQQRAVSAASTGRTRRVAVVGSAGGVAHVDAGPPRCERHRLVALGRRSTWRCASRLVAGLGPPELPAMAARHRR
jgi:hypothetical protein